jgi:hypothetical protein
MSSFLIQKAYALQTHIDVNTLLTLDSKKKTIRLFFITKALLYNSIEKDIKENFFSNDMIIYATPISHINEEYGEMLRTKIKVV